MKSYKQPGDALDFTPTIPVASDTGYQVGAALFGVAKTDVAANTQGAFQTTGVVEMAKTSALAIAKGDRLFWDPVNKVVNKTIAGQLCIGVAEQDAANPSPTVSVRLGYVGPVGV